MSYTNKIFSVLICILLLTSCSARRSENGKYVQEIDTKSQVVGSAVILATPTPTPTPTATATPPAVNILIQSSLSFGDLNTSNSNKILLNIQNNALSGVTVTGLINLYPFQLTGCEVGKVLPCTLSVSINPLAEAGIYKGDFGLILSTNETLKFPVSVNLTKQEKVAVSLPTLDLGSMLKGSNELLETPVTLTNSGSPVKIVYVRVTEPFVVSGCEIGTVLTANCLLKVSTLPGLAVGCYHGLIQIVTDTNQIIGIPVSAKILQASEVSASPARGELRSDGNKYAFDFSLSPAIQGQLIKIKSISSPAPFTVLGCEAGQYVGAWPCRIVADKNTPKGDYLGNVEFLLSSGQTLLIPFKLTVKDYLVDAYVTMGMYNCVSGYQVETTANLVGYCTFACGGMTICGKYITAIQAVPGTKVVTGYGLTGQGAHTESPYCGGSVNRGSIPDCYGNRCWGGRALCVSFQNY